MTSKLIFLVLLVANLSWATDSKSDDDATMIQSYLLTQDPELLRLQWDGYFKRVVNILDIGKQMTIRWAKWGQVEAAVKEWIEVEREKYQVMEEEKAILNGLRKPAMEKAPREWAQAIQLSIQKFEEFKEVASSGNAKGTRRSIILLRNSFRQLDVKLRRIIASRS